MGGFAWALGSVRVDVLGHLVGKCVFDYQWEVEGAGNYAVYRVRVPNDSGPVVIEAGRERGDAKNHWSYIFTTFTREQAVLVRKANFGWLDDLVDGTEDFVAHRRAALGKGPAAAKGDKATMHFAVYLDAKFDRLADEAKQGQTVELTVGADNAWKWLNVAAADMSVGEKRQVKVPVKLAHGAREWVPGAKAGVTLYLEMELISAEHSKR
jgi:hypothetical protein